MPPFPSPLTKPLAPGWVLGETEISGRVLHGWREKGWLTPPGAGLEWGSGHPFPWEDAIPQILWLSRLDFRQRFHPADHGNGTWLDDEDALAGWRLRATRAKIAYRLGREPWQPLPRVTSVNRLLAQAWRDDVILTLAWV